MDAILIRSLLLVLSDAGYLPVPHALWCAERTYVAHTPLVGTGGLALLSAAVGGLLLLLALVLDRGVSKVDGAVQYIRAGIYRAQ